MARSYHVLSVPVHHVTLCTACSELLRSVREGEKGYVIFRDVHGVVRCQDDPEFMAIHRQATLVCPDGMPLVWLGKKPGAPETGRVYGPDMMRKLMDATRDGSRTHFLYGGNVGVATKLIERLEFLFPGIRIVGTYTPPFGPLSREEEQELKGIVNQVRPDFFWVGLSTPKQEIFMKEYLPQLNTTVMLGVGAAFDYLSGEIKEPPEWMRKTGLQWLVRIFQEPKRLFGRYLRTIPRFVFLLLRERFNFDRKKNAH